MKKVLRHRRIFVKINQDILFGLFWKSFEPKKMLFYAPSSPSKLVSNGAQSAFKKIHDQRIVVPTGDPLVGEGSNN